MAYFKPQIARCGMAEEYEKSAGLFSSTTALNFSLKMSTVVILRLISTQDLNKLKNYKEKFRPNSLFIKMVLTY
jgi:hypothetical protein